MKAGQRLDDKEYVFYSVDNDDLRTIQDPGAFLFKDAFGLFIGMVYRDEVGIGFYKLYLIGEL